MGSSGAAAHGVSGGLLLCRTRGGAGGGVEDREREGAAGRLGCSVPRLRDDGGLLHFVASAAEAAAVAIVTAVVAK
jgi:hypothetical protein